MNIKLCNIIVHYIYMYYVRTYKAKCVFKTNKTKSSAWAKNSF